MRVIVRKERPHPGAQLRFTDIGGHRFTCLATSTKGGQLADLGTGTTAGARCEDRIRRRLPQSSLPEDDSVALDRSRLKKGTPD